MSQDDFQKEIRQEDRKNSEYLRDKVLEMSDKTFDVAISLAKIVITLHSGGLVAIAAFLTSESRQFAKPQFLELTLLTFAGGIASMLCALVAILLTRARIMEASFTLSDALDPDGRGVYLANVRSIAANYRKGNRWALVAAAATIISIVLFFAGLWAGFEAAGVGGA